MKQLFFVIVVACLTGCFGAAPEKTGLEGKPLPAFNILLPDSTTWFNTGSIPAGKPVVLFYLSPYCPYCRAQVKEIIEDIDRLKDIRFYLITSHPLPALKNFYAEFELSKYPNILSGVDTARFISDYFEIEGVPYLAVYGKNKTLNKTFMGKVYSSQLKKAAEE